MTNKEKAKEEFIQVYIEHCKKCKEIASIKNPYGMLDGHGRETKELTIKLYEDASKIFNKVFFDE